jgi:hypothetical protein
MLNNIDTLELQSNNLRSNDLIPPSSIKKLLELNHVELDEIDEESLSTFILDFIEKIDNPVDKLIAYFAFTLDENGKQRNIGMIKECVDVYFPEQARFNIPAIENAVPRQKKITRDEVGVRLREIRESMKKELEIRFGITTTSTEIKTDLSQASWIKIIDDLLDRQIVPSVFLLNQLNINETIKQKFENENDKVIAECKMAFINGEKITHKEISQRIKKDVKFVGHRWRSFILPKMRAELYQKVNRLSFEYTNSPRETT